MRLVSGTRYDALNTRYQQVIEQRDDLAELASKRLATITRQAAELAYFRDQNPDAPLPYPKPAGGDVELRRQLHLARRALLAQQEQLASMRQANESLAAELRAVREGAAS